MIRLAVVETPGHPRRSDSSGPHPPGGLALSREIARILDAWFRIPGTQIRVGLDPILGLFPGVGDWIGWVASSHLLWTAWRLGANASTLLRMTGHLLIDAVVGTVPLVGDLFDIGWRANSRNLVILERLADEPHRLHRASRFIVGGLLAVIGGVVLVAGWVGWRVLNEVVALAGAIWAGGL